MDKKKTFTLTDKKKLFLLMDEWWDSKQLQLTGSSVDNDATITEEKIISSSFYQTLLSKSEKCANDLQELKNKLIFAQEQLEQSVVLLRDKEEIIDKLKKENIDISTQNDVIVSQHNNMLNKYNDLSTEYKDKVSQYNDMLNKYNSLSTEYKNKVSQYNGILEQFNDITSKYDDMASKFDKLSTKYKEQDIVLQEQTAKVKSSRDYFQLKELLDKINKLSKEEVAIFKLIFKNIDDPLLCIMAFSSNMTDIHKTLLCEVAKGNIKSLTPCKNLFLYLINQCNRMYSTPVFVEFSPKVGERFDSDEMVRLNDSDRNGKVSDVLLPGFKRRNKDIAFKCIVNLQ